MKVFLCIMGILMAICGFALAATPLLTLWETNYFFIILLIVYGVSAIIRGISKKEFGSSFFFGILSVIAGLLILFVPGLKFMTSATIIYMMAFWFLLQGIVSIVMGVRAKKAGAEKWLSSIIIGILSIILGAYSLVHPMALAFSMGMLIGVYFVISGINLLVLAFTVKKAAA